MTSLSDALLPLLRNQLDASGRAPRLVFLSGAQGIGKSTALKAAVARLDANVCGLGIDDFYLPKAARRALARKVHPLFETRGPPGTHDIPLLRETLGALRAASPSSRVTLPTFSKAADDRLGEHRLWTGSPDLILLEGWLMGVDADLTAPHAPPLNRIEAEDPQGLWRGYQEDCLATTYAALWDTADAFIHLDAPGFSAVLAWRLQQEADNLGKPPGTLTPAETAWTQSFILHYQRLTERLLSGRRRAGDIIRLGPDRQVL